MRSQQNFLHQHNLLVQKFVAFRFTPLPPTGRQLRCADVVAIMAQDDETIAIYSHANFSAEMAAKIFFSDHIEAEVNHKLHELANLQVKMLFYSPPSVNDD
jgi:hypothetical protein